MHSCWSRAGQQTQIVAIIYTSCCIFHSYSRLNGSFRGTGTARLLCLCTVKKCSHSHVFKSLYDSPTCLIERAENTNGFMSCSGIQDRKIQFYIIQCNHKEMGLEYRSVQQQDSFHSNGKCSHLMFQIYSTNWCVWIWSLLGTNYWSVKLSR